MNINETWSDRAQAFMKEKVFLVLRMWDQPIDDLASKEVTRKMRQLGFQLANMHGKPTFHRNPANMYDYSLLPSPLAILIAAFEAL